MFDPIRPLAKHIFFPFLAWREGSTVPQHLKELEKSQFLSADRIAQMQMDRLKALVSHAYKNCPFYTKRFDEAGFNPSKLHSPDDYLAIPVLTKADIQNNLDQLASRNLPAEELVPDKTGGSTGKPLNYYISRDRIWSRNAAAIRHDRWTGWDIGQKSGYLWGHHGDMTGLTAFKARLRNWLHDRRLILDTATITTPKLEQFRKDLLSYNPTIYVGYANSVYLYARYLQESGATHYHRPKAVVTSAELLDGQQRKVIEGVFGCKVFDRYGSRETSIIASECDQHTGLHICAENIYIEIIADNRPAAPGQLGKVVVTDLMNYGMPFIRYQIEDVGKASEKRDCPCGRGLPLMEMAAGRVTDFLVTPDGKIISGASLTIFLIANTPGLAQAQFYQDRKDEITLRLVKGPKFSDESRRFLDTEIPKFFGPSVRYHLDFVDSIPVEASGKYRFSISRLDMKDMF